MRYKNKYFITILFCILGVILYSSFINHLKANIFFGNKGKATYENSGINKEVELKVWRASSVKEVSASDGTYTNKVKITWNKLKIGSINAERYYIYRSALVNGSYTNLGNTASTSYDDNTASSGILYYYKVKAYHSSYEYNKYSKADSGYLGLSAPANIIASDGTYTNKINIIWNSVAGAEKYYIYHSKSPQGTYSNIGNTISTSYDDIINLIGTNYYKIKAYSSGIGYSEYSDYDGGYVFPAPTGISASDGTYTNKINITWNGVIGAEKYYVYRSTLIAGSYIEIANTISTFYDDILVFPNTNYYYKIRSYSSSIGYSYYSTNNGGFLKLNSPIGISASDGIYTNKINITWNSVISAEKYYIYRSTVSNGFYSEISNTTSTNYNDTTIALGIYYYKIEAYSSSFGYSGYSSYDSGYLCDSLTNNLIAYYSFDIDASDDYDNKNGTVVGAIHMTIGQKLGNGCYYFDGDDKIIISSYKGISGSQNRTISAWVKTTSFNSIQFIVTWGDWLGNNFYRDWFTCISDGNELGVRIDNGYMYWFAPTISDGQWHHIAIVLNGSILNNVTGYFDGEEAFMKSGTPSDVVNTFMIDDVIIGGVSSPVYSYYFNGDMDEVGIWNRALTSSEISYLYNNGNGYNPLE